MTDTGSNQPVRIRAAVYDGNGTVTIEDVDLAAPGPGEVRVKIAAAGVCHSDLHLVTGDWPHPAPLVLGHEGSGVVTAVGARLAGAARIVAVDLVASKLDLARELGATDTVNAQESPDVVQAMRDVVADGYDYVFDAIGKISTTEQAIAALAVGGAAVVVGLPPAGQRASFDPLALAEADQRILGSNYGSAVPDRDIPALVDEIMAGDLDIASMISGRRPLAEAAAALNDLAAGHALRQLLIP